MITQKDVHNQIVENTSIFQKAYLAFQCQLYGVDIKDMEQTIANIVNGVANVFSSDTMQYLCKRME